jgi:hypothetical protein
MEITNAGHSQIRVVTISEWIARVEACSPTSNVRTNYYSGADLVSQSVSWKYGK